MKIYTLCLIFIFISCETKYKYQPIIHSTDRELYLSDSCKYVRSMHLINPITK
jgi:hypothetical protein